LIESRGHELRAMLPANSPLVHGDATRLAQVFVNLLNNASKYTPKGGHIDIDIASHGGELMVSVRDDGIGIAPDELPRIFELFAQSGRAPDSAPTGLGIGLSLVKKVVELHGGSVAARSAGLGRGAVVEVRLPVVQATDAPALQVPPSADPRLIEPRRVLVVDDNRDIADSLATILSTMGFDTKVAYDGEQASKVVETFQPHAAVLDIGLPKLDGNELCRFIRRQHWGKDATVIAVTGLGQPADRLKSQEAGFNHYFVKPIDPQNIVDILPANR
jgi:CheY-like chemotaxis protein